MGASGKPVFPEGVFVLASILRLVTLSVLVGFVVRDILKPEKDVVRQTYADDPDGGAFDGAPDGPLVESIRRLFGGPAAALAPAGTYAESASAGSHAESASAGAEAEPGGLKSVEPESVEPGSYEQPPPPPN
jgi:hypothetical protein